MADAIGQLSSHPSILDLSQICYILLCLTAHSTGFVTGTSIKKNDWAKLVL